MALKNTVFSLLVLLLSVLSGVTVAYVELLPPNGVPTVAKFYPNPTPLMKRTGSSGGCNADNVLRALRRFSASAVPFCSSYINIPKRTVTVTAVSTFCLIESSVDVGSNVAHFHQTTTTKPGFTVSQTTTVETTQTSSVYTYTDLGLCWTSQLTPKQSNYRPDCNHHNSHVWQPSRCVGREID